MWHHQHTVQLTATLQTKDAPMLKKTTLLASSSLLTLAVYANAHAGWQDLLNETATQLLNDKTVVQTSSALVNNSEVATGLKEALASGVESAIKQLGKDGGFMGNKLVEIPIPSSLAMIEKTTRELGQGQYADQFISTMNGAAESAVPQAAELLAEAIRQMSVEDATNILNGPDDAATQYFRKVSGEQLADKFKPIIEQATNEFGVTLAYKNLASQASSMLDASPLAAQATSLLNNTPLAALAPTDALDIDQYVTDKTLDGLFKYIALEEKNIRENPVARTTDLLAKVFSGK